MNDLSPLAAALEAPDEDFDQLRVCFRGRAEWASALGLLHFRVPIPSHALQRRLFAYAKLWGYEPRNTIDVYREVLFSRAGASPEQFIASLQREERLGL